jgi:hypothetical protein
MKYWISFPVGLVYVVVIPNEKLPAFIISKDQHSRQFSDDQFIKGECGKKNLHKFLWYFG